MSLRHAILGILEAKPRHGYELKSVLDLAITGFWPVNLAAIYPNLRRLEDEGLLVSHMESGALGRPDRKVYEVTESGREELARWRQLPPDGPAQVKDPLLLKLAFAKTENLADAVRWIDKEIEVLRPMADMARSAMNQRPVPSPFVQYMRESATTHTELRIENLEALRQKLIEKLRAGEALE